MRNLPCYLALLALLGLQTITFAQADYHEKVATYLNQHHEKLGLNQTDVTNFRITDNYVSRHNGVRHIHICQEVNGYRVLNGTANVTLDKNQQVVHVANRLVPGITQVGQTSPTLTAKDAITQAAQDLELQYDQPVNLKTTIGSEHFEYAKGDLSLEDIPVELVYWADAESNLQLAWSLSIYQTDAKHWWHAIIDAQTGEMLKKIDWVVECTSGVCGALTSGSHNHVAQPGGLAPAPKGAPDSYRVYALPVESPSHGGRTLEVNPRDSMASPFAWHDTDGLVGHEYTITRGNNVFAYEDVANNNAPGYSPDGGNTLDFDFPINLSSAPSAYQDAAITNLFYTNNRIHDILYHYGFDEESGNFQTNNYGRGGTGGDEVRAEAQDGGGSNNANFATPPDGSSGRMQMYLWSAGSGDSITINSPGTVAGKYGASTAGFGAPLPSTPLTADLAIVIDSVGPDTLDACETILNPGDLNGKIALIRRGNCTFVLKVEAAEAAGAVAVIMVNNVPGGPITMGGSSNNITIPSVMISQADGQQLFDEILQGNTVNATLDDGGSSSDLDGDLDNGIIVHEYGHGVSNRLTGGPSAAGCLSNAEQMGEGWSDYLTCMLTMDFTAPNPVNKPIGSYAIGNPPSGPGIRNEAYDTSFAVNNYTYGDVANTGQISQPHGIGFVWATMLWDLTWDLMEEHGFDDDLENGTGGDNIALQLVMDGMKLQPCDPGFVDGRDAILLADQLNNGGANQCLIWKSFARRGLGASADQGSPNSRTDQTEAFDLPTICQTPIVPPSANFEADTTETCDGRIQFTDLSTDIPQGWFWNFGDGNVDSIQNPTHTYTQAGVYSVKLVVTNDLGKDSLERVQYINFSPPVNPVADPVSVCTGDMATLDAGVTGFVTWMDETNVQLDTGTTYTTAPLTSNTTFHVVNELGSPAQKVGPVDETFGPGGQHGSFFTGTVDFTTETALTIRSAYVNADGPGPRDVNLWDAHSGGGTILQTVTINPIAGGQRVSLNFEVPGPGEYSIGLNNADLFRNNAGVSYPYTLPGVMSIVGSSAGSDFYYYFYDLEVKAASCYSDTVSIDVSVIDSVDFNYQDNGLTVDFTDLSGATGSWMWDFGDGNTSTDQNPQHTYGADGLYTVTLTIGSCGQSYEVAVGNIGIEEAWFRDIEMTLQPNPAREATLLLLSQPATEDVPLRLLSLDGRVVSTHVLPAGETQWKLDLSNLPASVYWLVPGDMDRGNALKVVKLR